MKKPLFTRVIKLSSRTHLGRLLHWSVQKDILAEIGPIQHQLDQLHDTVRELAALTQRRTFSLFEELIQVDKSLNKELWKITIGFGSAIVILSLGCLIGFLVN